MDTYYIHIYQVYRKTLVIMMRLIVDNIIHITFTYRICIYRIFILMIAISDFNYIISFHGVIYLVIK